MWYEIPVHFPLIGLKAFVVMPDHIHGIIVINRSISPPIVGALHATPLPQNDTKYTLMNNNDLTQPKVVILIWPTIISFTDFQEYDQNLNYPNV